MNVIKHMRVSSFAGQRILLAGLMMTLGLSPCLASEAGQAVDPRVKALEDIHVADWENRWLGYGIALAGSAGGIGLGGWALYDQPLSKDGRPDPVVFVSSLTLVGVATTQIVHGGMRFDERVQGATAARTLLTDREQREHHTMFFLEQRAQAARSTRFWGGLMTTAQGLSTTTLGVRLWMEGKDGIKTTGIVLTALGALNTAIGAVHFPGKPRSERVLDRTKDALDTQTRVNFRPVPMYAGDDRWMPGFSASGHF